MSTPRGKLHPGARLFEKAVASVKEPCVRHKSKSPSLKEHKTRGVTHVESVLKHTEDADFPMHAASQNVHAQMVDNMPDLSNIAGNFQADMISNLSAVPDEDNYSLPIMQSNSQPGAYTCQDIYSDKNIQFYSSPTNSNYSPYTAIYSPDPFGSSVVPYRTSMEYFHSSASHFNPSQASGVPSIYAFSCSNLSNDQSELSWNDFTTPGICSETPTDILDDNDYSLPLRLPTLQDSGCPSSDEENTSETSLDCNFPESMSYYHMVNQYESSSETNQASHYSHPEEFVLQMVPASLENTRVYKRVLPRIQGSSTSISGGRATRKSISTSKKCFSAPSQLSSSVDYSSPEVSTDEDPSPLRSQSSSNGCASCEKESENLYEEDSERQCMALPDYSCIKFLAFKSETGFIDSHCHLDFLFDRQNYDGTYSNYMLKHKDTYPATYEGCVAVFCNPHTFHKKTMWKKHLNENGVWGAFGCHPHNSKYYGSRIDDALRSALLHPKVRALGEIGLDYSNRNTCSTKMQHQVLRRQLKIAVSKKLPIVIHCRDANEDLMEIMTNILPRDHLIHLHCFTDGWDWAQKWLSEFPNLFIGITNLVTYNSAEPTHDVVKRIPLDRLLLETDAPHFVPRKTPRSIKFSHPGMAIHVAAQIATLRNLPLREIIHRTRQNTRKMYGI